MTDVYEVVDATDDQTYHTLGIYSTVGAALAACGASPDDPWQIGWDSDLFVQEIRRRPLDEYCDSGKKVAAVTYTRVILDDDSEGESWVRSVEHFQ